MTDDDEPPCRKLSSLHLVIHRPANRLLYCRYSPPGGPATVTLQAREKEISELKALVTRLTKNNQEMLGLLTERVSETKEYRV